MDCAKENEARKREIQELREEFLKFMKRQASLEEQVEEVASDVQELEKDMDEVKNNDLVELEQEIASMRDAQVASDVAFQEEIADFQDKLANVPAVVPKKNPADSSPYPINCGCTCYTPIEEKKIELEIAAQNRLRRPDPAILAGLPVQERAQMLGDLLYPKIVALQAELSRKVAHYLVHEEYDSIFPLLKDGAALKKGMGFVMRTASPPI